jgi:predicted CoA-binding protein
MTQDTFTVAVLGASAKPERYSYQCVERLLEHGHRVIPVTPAQVEICGIMPVSDLDAIDKDVDILTMYVNAARSSAMEEQILELNPAKIIFNPGAENPELQNKCEENEIKTENACTLVLLNTGQLGV